MNESAIKEELSIALVKAIVASAKYNHTLPNKDYGIDLEIQPIVEFNGKLMAESSILSVQLKASVNCKKSDDGNHLHFRLTHDDYLRLKTKMRERRKLLIVMDLPKNPRLWVQVSEVSLILKRCAYYIFSDHLPDWPEGQKSLQIEIPCTNLFTPESAKEIFDAEYERLFAA